MVTELYWRPADWCKHALASVVPSHPRFLERQPVYAKAEAAADSMSANETMAPDNSS